MATAGIYRHRTIGLWAFARRTSDAPIRIQPMLRRAAPAPLLVSVLLVAVPSAAAALPGDLDGSFSAPDGKATTNFTTGFDSASAVLVQSDTKVVAVGLAGGNGGRFAVVRYDSDGPLDMAGFGSGAGKVATDFTSGFDAAFDGALDADEKIVAVGRAGLLGGRFALARYNPDGTLDTGFGGGDGKVMTNFTTGDDFAFGLAIQSDGKIVAVGRAGGSGGVIALARYNADGSLDTTFGGSDGKVTLNLTRGDDRADAVAFQPVSEKIVVTGTANYFGANGRFAVAQFNTDGTLDASFSGDGRVTTDFTTGFDGGFGVAVQADGKVVAVGQARGVVGLARYNPEGTLDATFSGDGKATTNFTTGADYFDDITLDGAGKVVAAGAANFFGPNSRFALARYNTDGTLDISFSGDGKLTTDFTTGFDGAYGVDIAPDAKIVVGGYAGGSGGRFAVARYVG
jgi:uncharacterized delta-60 repeat protein